MQKKGIVKISFHSFISSRLKGNTCQVKVNAADVEFTASVPYKQQSKPTYYLLPVTEKIMIEMLSSNDEVGYFELPMKKLFQIPSKKHLITINCITRDRIQKTNKSEEFGSIKVSIVFMENWVGKFDVFVDRLELIEEKLGTVQRELYVECLVGNVASQTTLKNCKEKEPTWFEIKQLLPFTLQSIPGKIQLIIKDKDMVSDQTMGKFALDPQKQGFFEQSINKKNCRYELNVEKKKLIVYFQTSFKLKQSI